MLQLCLADPYEQAGGHLFEFALFCLESLATAASVAENQFSILVLGQEYTDKLHNKVYTGNTHQRLADVVRRSRSRLHQHHHLHQ